MTCEIHVGHVIDVLRTIPDESVQMCVTSPPYFGLRSYGTPPQVWGGDPNCIHEWGGELISAGGSGVQGANSQRAGRLNVEAQTKQRDNGQFCQLCGAWCGHLGLEPTIALYIEHIVDIFREVGRVLRADGVLYLNMGDSYSTNSGFGLKPKDLMMMPARVAIALQDDGWLLRSDIIWVKRSPMPESAVDRPTVAHEHIFLFAKRRHYFYDAAAVATPLQPKTFTSFGYGARATGNDEVGKVKSDNWGKSIGEHQPKLNGDGTLYGANLRNVWSIASQPYKGAHFAVFPEKLVELCVKAGTSEKGRCDNCGAPIRRKLAKADKRPKGGGWHDHAGDLEQGQRNAPSMSNAKFYESVQPKVMLGWEPTCDCFTEDEWKEEGMGAFPCRVLDPFAGSGTTGVVCERLGRDSILVELNPEYAINQAAARIRGDAPLLNKVELFQ